MVMVLAMALKMVLKMVMTNSMKPPKICGGHTNGFGVACVVREADLSGNLPCGEYIHCSY